jgi:sugar lactone lactonase YvrE
MIFDDRPCELGEGVFWHPERGQVFWFDILNRRLLSRQGDVALEWQMPEMTSACGWIGPDEVLLGSESGLWRFDLTTGARTRLAAIEADDPGTRSNDGRADRQGGFWLGTMGKRGGADAGRGAIWRWHRGTMRRLFDGLTIPNSICFDRAGRFAHFSDTLTHRIMKVALDAEGWPMGRPEVFIDLTAEGILPDGAVIDAEGNLWNAQWGAARVACYGPDGRFIRAVAMDAPQTSCPCFGGAGLDVLFCTSALEDMDAAARVAHPAAGRLFAVPGVGRGLAEPRVVI